MGLYVKEDYNYIIAYGLHCGRIQSGREVAHVNRIGEKLAMNIDEIIETGTLQRLEELLRVSQRFRGGGSRIIER